MNSNGASDTSKTTDKKPDAHEITNMVELDYLILLMESRIIQAS